jgi:Phosphotransferase enzyme family
MRSTTRRTLAPSVDALVDGASSREPLTSSDSKSGAQLERVLIDGARYVLKTVDRHTDWIARQAGDVGCWPVLAWEVGLVDLAPPCIDHTLVGAARTAGGGAVLMRDASEWLVPAGDVPLPLEQHLRFLDHLAAFHAACWGWVDDIGLWALGNRYSLFGPASLLTEESLGHPEPVTRVAAETPWTFLHGDWKLGNLGTHPDGRTVLVDWSLPGAGPPLAELAHYLALNRARLPVGHSKDDAIAAYRTSLQQRVDTEPWWDRQLALCLLGVMLQLAWNKIDDPTGEELSWWTARVDEGMRALS